MEQCPHKSKFKKLSEAGVRHFTVGSMTHAENLALPLTSALQSQVNTRRLRNARCLYLFEDAVLLNRGFLRRKKKPLTLPMERWFKISTFRD